MGFCGVRHNAFSVKEGVIKNECFIDVLNIVPHAIFSVFSLFILIIWNKSAIGKMKVRTWVHFKGHTIRWIATLLLIVNIIVGLAEGFMGETADPDTFNLHVIVPLFVQLAGTLLSIIFYHNLEQWNSPRFLLSLISYWTSCIVLRLLKSESLHHNGVTTDHIRLWLTWIDVVIYLILLLTELTFLLVQKYAFFSKQIPIHPSPDLGKSDYIFAHVNFLSKITCFWVLPLLRVGFKNPLEMENLGLLPESELSITNYKKLKAAFDYEKNKAEVKGKMPSLHMIYMRAFWPMLLCAAILRLIGDMLAFIGPWCVEHIVTYAYKATMTNSLSDLANSTTTVFYDSISDNLTLLLNTVNSTQVGHYILVSEFLENGYVLCGILFVVTVVQLSALQFHHFLVIREGIRVKLALQR